MRLRLTRWLQARGWRRLSKLSSCRGGWVGLLLSGPAPDLPHQRHRRVGGAVRGLPPVAVLPRYKIDALKAYAWHRPRCVLFADPPITAPLLASAEQRHHLPCGLLGAIVHVESGGQPHRISSAGAMGPMQLIPPTARALGVSDPFDPEESVDGAARYLHTQFARFHSIRLAAAAYNAGPGAIVGRRVPHNGQTEIYVDRVMRALAVERHARCVPPRRASPVARARRAN